MPENIIQKQKREKRDKEIVKMYPQKTLMEIGKIYNLKAQRIHQIIIKQGKEVTEKVKVAVP
mgnify:CR=1 FL=1